MKRVRLRVLCVYNDHNLLDNGTFGEYQKIELQFNDFVRVRFRSVSEASRNPGRMFYSPGTQRFDI